MKIRITLLLMVLGCLQSIAQKEAMLDSLHLEDVCTGDGWCIPTLEGLPRPKGVVFNTTWVSDFDMTSNDNQLLASDEVNIDQRTEFSLRFPFLLKDHLKITGSLGYEAETLTFSSQTDFNHPFHNYLNELRLKTIESNLLVLKPLKGRHFLAGIFSYKRNSDFLEENTGRKRRFSSAIFYGSKRNKNTSLAAGLSYNNTFGRTLIVPVFVILHRWNDVFSMDLVLPVNAQLRCVINEKNILLAEAKVSGDKYSVFASQINSDPLFLEKSNIYSSITYEREIYDFLWFNASVGFRTNLNFELTQIDDFLDRGNALITSSLQNTFYLNTGIFIVPPRKWMN